jgi:hypothetical protein
MRLTFARARRCFTSTATSATSGASEAVPAGNNGCDAEVHDMTDRGYWRHVGSERIWAVEIEDGRPVKCAGPFDVRDVARDILEHLDYSTTYVGPLQAEWQWYVPLRLCYVCGTALRGAAVTPDGGAHLSCPV